MATVEFSLQHPGTLEGHNPSLGKHQVFSCPRVSTSALALVHHAIENKIGLEHEDLGEHQVKNIDKPVRAYRVLSCPGAAAHRVVKAKKAVGKTWRNAIAAIVAVLLGGAAVTVWNFYYRHPLMEPVSKKDVALTLPEKPSIR